MKSKKNNIKMRTIKKGGGKNIEISIWNDQKEWETLKEFKEYNNKQTGKPLFQSNDDVNDHINFMYNLSNKNNWVFLENNEFYFGSLFNSVYDHKSKKTKYSIKDGYKISDVLETWLKESLSIECEKSLMVFLLLKLYRIYGYRINKIIKTLQCETCSPILGTFTAINMDNNMLFHTYNHKYYEPQTNRYETDKMANNTQMGFFGYIRNNYGYLSIDYSGLDKFIIPKNEIKKELNYLDLSGQGHNIIISNNDIGDKMYSIFETLKLHRPNEYSEDMKSKSVYLTHDRDIKTEWFKVIDDFGTQYIDIVKKKNNIPNQYKVTISNKSYLKNHDDWYGIFETYDVAYQLPKKFV